MQDLKNKIIKILTSINYPGYRRDIVSFGLIESLDVVDKNILLTLSSSISTINQLLASVINKEIN